ncbi:MAG: energy transducer TonB [Janthinobacterium lividum]
MSFQLFTLEGKPSEQGTLEEWWSFNSGARLNVTTPTLGTIHSLRIDQSSQDAGRRSIFLIEDMVTSTTRPAGTLNRRSEVTAKDQSVGSVLLHCLATKPGANSFSVCTGEADKTIRVVAQPNRILIRNRIGKLNDAEVALDEKISYCGRDAITGHVEALESFAPTSDDVETQTPVTVPGQVLAGMKLSGDPPLYPVSARMNHISGVVFLGGYINELGKIDYVFPIASPSPMLTGAALTAIKQWTYRPYLLNGKPVGVNTVITTNFNLSIR